MTLNIDYSEEIKEVAEPMLKNLETFYQKNKRFPTDKERDEMLLASGCESVVGGVCERDGSKIKILKAHYPDDYSYDVELNKATTFCLFTIYKNGVISKVSCEKLQCIKMGKQ